MLYHLSTYLYHTVAALSFLRLFGYLSFRAIGAALTAFAVTVLFGERMIHFLYLKRIRDVPREYVTMSAADKSGTPTMGGLLIIFAVVTSMALWCDLLSRFAQIVFFAFAWFTVLGGMDDYLKLKHAHSDRGLSQATKFFCQVAFGLILGAVFLMPGVSPVAPTIASKLYLPFIKAPILDLGWWYLPFIAFVVVAIANSVNFADGLDGLAIVPVSFTIAVYGVFAYVIGNTIYSSYLQFFYLSGSGELTVICAAIFGASLGFLWYNAYPAQVFMGDVGSLTLGGIIGTLAVLLKQEFLFLIVGGVFVIEAFSVLIQEKIGVNWLGRRMFYRAPIHQTFQHRGLAETKVVVRFWIIAGILALIGLSTLKIR
ncbi:MAG: phospho-N-acetylmuramoyl-pentapeptide-transferase [Candidatus Latescibacteria bacterium]|nr:phospho-N-acetylmuramoyl-pentapeptide-transferase [Candidatus Latescibacterota bacterium]